MEECLKDCMDCHLICQETLMYCLQMGGAHADVAHAGLLLDCAQICGTTGDFLSRGSSVHALVCAVCAQICNACADSCENFGGDTHMEACAEQCRKCAQSCELMAAP